MQKGAAAATFAVFAKSDNNVYLKIPVTMLVIVGGEEEQASVLSSLPPLKKSC